MINKTLSKNLQNIKINLLKITYKKIKLKNNYL